MIQLPEPRGRPRSTPGRCRVTEISVDLEAGPEAFSYVLHSGHAGTVHVEQVLEYNEDPTYLRDLLLYRLTLEAQKRVAESPLPKREIMRRLGTCAAQRYRLLDQTNYRKSVDQLLALLQVLNCDVDLIAPAGGGVSLGPDGDEVP